jgi:hypothetical protein
MCLGARLIILLDGQGHVVMKAQTVTPILIIANVSEPRSVSTSMIM